MHKFEGYGQFNDKIRDALIKTCEILNINFKIETEVNEIKCLYNKFSINNDDFDAVIVATGGTSQKSQGSDGSGYKLLKNFGHKIEVFYQKPYTQAVKRRG